SLIILRRKICSRIKRLAFRSKKRRKRPAALSADGLHRRLVAAVHVRALVAINLDGDEMLVHDRRNLRALIGLAVHHMAPVAPYRADVEQDGLVLALRSLKRFRPPLMPVDGLVHGRTQIRRSGVRQGIESLGAHSDSVQFQSPLSCEYRESQNSY